MKLSFVNFRHFEKREFDLPDSGLIQLCGDNGRGKSTLFAGILYVFFGSSLIKKPYTYDKKTCKVEMNWKGVTIIRSSSPNTLSFSQKTTKLEGIQAQSAIHNLIGIDNGDVFLLSSMLGSNWDSFLEMKPTKKLDVIGALSGNLTVKEILEKRKEKHSSLTKVRTLKEGELKGLSSLTHNFVDMEPRRDILSLKKELDQVEKEIDLENNLLKAKLDELEKGKNVSYSQQQLNDLKSKRVPCLDDSSLANIQASINTLKKKRDNLKVVSSLEDKKSELNQRVEEYKKTMSSLPTQAQRDKLNDDLEKMKMEKDEHDKIEDRLRPLLDEVKDTFETIDPNVLLVKIKEVENDLNESTLDGVQVSCPSCSSDLVFSNSSLRLHNENDKVKTQEDFDYLNGILKSTRECVELLGKRIDFDQKEFMKLKKKKEEIDRLMLKRNDSMVTFLESEIEKLNEEIEKKKADGVDFMEDDLVLLTKKLNVEREKKEKMKFIDEQIVSLESKLSSMSSVDLEIASKVVDEKREKIEEATKRMKDLRKKFMLAEDYNKKYDEEQRKKNIFEKVNVLRNELIESDLDIKALDEIKEGAIEAQCLTVSKNLEMINGNVNGFLNVIYNPSLRIIFDNVKEMKNEKTKFEINTRIINGKKSEVEFGDLSDGEKQKCNLSTLLAFNSLKGSHFLFLDECLNHLSAEKNNEVLTFLKEIGSKKMILVVAHESVSGMYDNIINV
jgi:DNA repair exonuclease SbcCD ATPase subunit